MVLVLLFYDYDYDHYNVDTLWLVLIYEACYIWEYVVSMKWVIWCDTYLWIGLWGFIHGIAQALVELLVCLYDYDVAYVCILNC